MTPADPFVPLLIARRIARNGTLPAQAFPPPVTLAIALVLSVVSEVDHPGVVELGQA